MGAGGASSAPAFAPGAASSLASVSDMGGRCVGAGGQGWVGECFWTHVVARAETVTVSSTSIDLRKGDTHHLEAMLRLLAALALFLAPATALVVAPTARPAAAAPVRAASPQMRDVVRVQIDIEQGEPCAAAPSPA